eukprot:m.366626 g.366626  ORF g.366626 m.366626 type:complete len:79 (-) comp36918_c0_seq1:9-245(-)
MPPYLKEEAIIFAIAVVLNPWQCGNTRACPANPNTACVCQTCKNSVETVTVGMVNVKHAHKSAHASPWYAYFNTLMVR